MIPCKHNYKDIGKLLFRWLELKSLGFLHSNMPTFKKCDAVPIDSNLVASLCQQATRSLAICDCTQWILANTRNATTSHNLEVSSSCIGPDRIGVFTTDSYILGWKEWNNIRYGFLAFKANLYYKFPLRHVFPAREGDWKFANLHCDIT